MAAIKFLAWAVVISLGTIFGLIFLVTVLYVLALAAGMGS